jgi:hypothetical protein
MVNIVTENKMRAQDIIRALLDVIDQQKKEQVDQMIPNEPGEQTSRFKQIFSALNQRTQSKQYSNSPGESVEDIDAVTTLAGGGVNGPKHPADIRVKDPRGYE